MSAFSNSNNGSIPLPALDRLPFGIVCLVLFSISIIVNYLIIWIVYKDRRLRTTTNYLIANMAVSDLVSAVLGAVNIIAVVRNRGWPVVGVFGNILCKTTIYLIEVTFSVSVFSCVFIAIDRYYAVAYPIKKPLRKIKYIIAGIWLISGLMNTGDLFWLKIDERNELVKCSVPVVSLKTYSTYRKVVQITTCSLPTLAVTMIYPVIIYKLRHHKVPGHHTDVALRRRELQNRKVLKMSITIVVMLYLSFGFYSIVQTLIFSRRLSHVSIFDLSNLYWFSFVMLSLSLVYNFFIYLFFNDIYRENIKMIASKYCCRLRKLSLRNVIKKKTSLT